MYFQVDLILKLCICTVKYNTNDAQILFPDADLFSEPGAREPGLDHLNE